MNNEIEECYSKIITNLGEDISREGLRETPRRVAQAMKYLTRGYHQTIQDAVNGAVFSSNIDEMIVVKNIELYSLCEHHLLPFIGKCHVAYMPKGKVLGLSKVARVVDVFAQRLQTQENLTQQIAKAIMEAVDAAGVGVIIEAKHLCMMMRGVEKQNSTMTTSVMLGQFKTDEKIRAEVFKLLQHNLHD